MEKGRRAKAVLFFILCSVVVVMVGWTVCTAQSQRKPFDHTLHIETIDDPESCTICHFDDSGTFAGLPVLQNCTDCHDASDEQVWEQVEDIIMKATYKKARRKI